MRTMTKILTVTTALVVALSLAPLASASCGTLASIGTVTATGRTFVFNPTFEADPSFYYGPNGPSVFGYGAPGPLSGAASVSFWALGRGNTTIGVGDDNGSVDIIGLGQLYYYGYAASTPAAYGYSSGAEIFTNWLQGGIDGCVNADSCNCLLINDQDGDNGFFAVVAGVSNPSFNTSINLGGADGGTGNMPIKLVPIAAPGITGSVRDGVTFDTDVTVKLAAPTAGVYAGAGTRRTVRRKLRPRSASGRPTGLLFAPSVVRTPTKSS